MSGNNDRKNKSKYEKKVHAIEGAECDSDYDPEWINKIAVCADKPKQIKCKMNVDEHLVCFQIDSGSSVNMLPRRYVKEEDILPSNKMLKVWNKENYKPIGECRKIIKNPKNSRKYNVKFEVCDNEYMPIIGLSASQQMKLIEIKSDNFVQINMIDIKKHEEVFNDEIGTFEGEHSFRVKKGAKPTIMPNRRVPIAMRQPIQEELQRLVQQKIIEPVTQATEWVSQCVIVKKSNNRIRICLDPQELNKVLIRERYELPTLDDILHELLQAKIFSKFDLSSGYWHVKLDRKSSLMTTFQTHNGRYRWLRLPFGVSVAAEIFQRKLNEALYDLKGVTCVADDIIVYGRNMQEHDDNLGKFLTRCNERGIKLNKEKTKLRVDHITFMGHKITRNGLEIDPQKIAAITKFQAPENVSQLRTFLGMVNFIAKFVPKLSDIIIYPLHNLLKKEVKWMWSEAQEKSFQKVKNMIIEHNKLTIFDPNAKITIENDASEYGIGSVLMQNDVPVAYASRSLTNSERNYAQIEKEMLAIVFGLKKFHNYVYGQDKISIITDHKPLTFIVKKPLCKASKRLQSMLLKTQEYSFELFYREGTKIPIADALSRFPDTDKDIHEDVNTVNNLDDTPMNKTTQLKFKEETEKDAQLIMLKNVISVGWPTNKEDLQPELRPYYHYRDEMTVENGIVLRGERIVVPKTLRYEMKKKIHTGHMGINSCLRRARTYLYWPNMSSELKAFVENCATCSTYHTRQATQPLYPHATPNRPWQKLGLDIFTIRSRNYLITVDYYSGFFEVDYLTSMTTESVIKKLKPHISRYGIPDVLYSDNGPCFASRTFKNFCSAYEMKHETCSPGNSKANGCAEAAVKIAKNMMKRSFLEHEDPYLALLYLRNTPQEGTDSSPVQRLMGRRTKTLIPTVPSLLNPATQNHETFVTQKEEKKEKMCRKFQNRNPLPPLNSGDTVRMQPIDGSKIWKEGTIVNQQQDNARSYTVKDNNGIQYRRDRQYLRYKPSASNQQTDVSITSTRQSDHEASLHDTPAMPDNRDPTTRDNLEATGQQHPAHSNNKVPTNASTAIARENTIYTRSGRAINKPKRYGFED